MVVVRYGGGVSVPDAAQLLNTSENLVFNLSRELRLMGVVTYEPLRVRLVDEVLEVDDKETALREKIASALRRHRAFSTLVKLCEARGGPVSIPDFALSLPDAFPAVVVRATTWLSYARAFVYWFAYAHLLSVTRNGVVIGRVGDESDLQLLGGSHVRPKVQRPFPQSPAGPAIRILKQLRTGTEDQPLKAGTRQDALRDLVALGAVSIDSHGRVGLVDVALVDDSGGIDTARLLERINELPGCRKAIELLRQDPGASPVLIGSVIRDAYEASWAISTTISVGKYFRGWARAIGLRLALRAGAAQTSYSLESGSPIVDGEVADRDRDVRLF